METSERGALLLIRTIGVALIGWAALELTLYWLVCRKNETDLATLTCFLKSLPMLAGMVVLIFSRRISEWISNILDD